MPSLKREYNVVAPARPCRTAPTAPLRPAGQRQQLLGVVVATARSAVHNEAAAVVARREEHAALSARQRRWAQHGPAQPAPCVQLPDLQGKRRYTQQRRGFEKHRMRGWLGCALPQTVLPALRWISGENSSI